MKPFLKKSSLMHGPSDIMSTSASSASSNSLSNPHSFVRVWMRPGTIWKSKSPLESSYSRALEPNGWTRSTTCPSAMGATTVRSFSKLTSLSTVTAAIREYLQMGYGNRPCKWDFSHLLLSSLSKRDVHCEPDLFRLIFEYGAIAFSVRHGRGDVVLHTWTSNKIQINMPRRHWSTYG